MSVRLTIGLYLYLTMSSLMAQNPLDARISISFDKISLNELFNELAVNGDCQFSYNPDILPNSEVSGQYANTRIKAILQDALGESYQYKVRGSYIIVQVIEKSDLEKVDMQFQGEIADAETGEKLRGTSIYEINRLTATLSDKDGIYSLQTIGSPRSMSFAVSKKNYQDTIIQVDPNQKEPFKIFLRPLEKQSKEKKSKVSPVDTVKIVRFLVNKREKEHMENISLSEERSFQVSFLPGFGTNGFLGGEVTNHFSFNILAGYNGGLKGLEIGGLVNIDRADVSGLQIGGLSNIVGGKTNGIQVGGFSNINMKTVNGIQMAGFINVAKESDVQIAGFVNTSRDHAIQIGGLGNIAVGETRGTQIAGMFNINSQTVQGLQLAGFFNTAKDGKVQIAGFVNQTRDNVMQISGFSNFSRQSKGGQIAGLSNFAWEKVDGVQISGLFNYARTIKGAQIGVINVAKNYEKGVPFGMFNFIKEGKHRLEINHNDLTDVNFNYKGGINQFYSVASIGISPKAEIWSFGWGLGTEISIKEDFYTDIEMSVHNVQSTDHYISGESLDYRFNWSVGYNFSKLASINAGPVLHFYDFSPEKAEDASFADTFGTSNFFKRQQGDGQLKMWLGYRVAITLL